MIYQVGCDISKVSTHSRPKAAGCNFILCGFLNRFQHTAARRRLGNAAQNLQCFAGFNTQPPEGGWIGKMAKQAMAIVSTHSRPKAAGGIVQIQNFRWEFQHTAARRRLGDFPAITALPLVVSTHSRPKAAGLAVVSLTLRYSVSTHSRPKAAG